MTKGKRIKQLREENRITQEELAVRLNTTKQTISKYEKDIVTNIPSDKIEALSLILGTTPSYILGWDQDEIEAISEQIDDKNGYIDNVELALKALFEEFGRLHLSYEDIQLIKDYSNSVKGNEELYRYMAKARRRFVELQLNEEETEEMIKYAEFLVSKRKKG